MSNVQDLILVLTKGQKISIGLTIPLEDSWPGLRDLQGQLIEDIQMRCFRVWGSTGAEVTLTAILDKPDKSDITNTSVILAIEIKANQIGDTDVVIGRPLSNTERWLKIHVRET